MHKRHRLRTSTKHAYPFLKGFENTREQKNPEKEEDNMQQTGLQTSFRVHNEEED